MSVPRRRVKRHGLADPDNLPVSSVNLMGRFPNGHTGFPIRKNQPVFQSQCFRLCLQLFCGKFQNPLLRIPSCRLHRGSRRIERSAGVASDVVRGTGRIAEDDAHLIHGYPQRGCRYLRQRGGDSLPHIGNAHR